MKHHRLLKSLTPLRNFDIHSVKLVASSRRLIMTPGISGFKEVWNILFVTHDDQVYAVGANRFGELGLGDRVPRSFPERISVLSGKKIRSISINDCNANAITEDGKLYLWGHNLFGK